MVINPIAILENATPLLVTFCDNDGRKRVALPSVLIRLLWHFLQACHNAADLPLMGTTV